VTGCLCLSFGARIMPLVVFAWILVLLDCLCCWWCCFFFVVFLAEFRLVVCRSCACFVFLGFVGCLLLGFVGVWNCGIVMGVGLVRQVVVSLI